MTIKQTETYNNEQWSSTYFIQWSKRFQCPCPTWTVSYRTGSIKLYMQHKYTTINTNLCIIFFQKKKKKTHLEKKQKPEWISHLSKMKHIFHILMQLAFSTDETLPITGSNTVHFWQAVCWRGEVLLSRDKKVTAESLKQDHQAQHQSTHSVQWTTLKKYLDTTDRCPCYKFWDVHGGDWSDCGFLDCEVLPLPMGLRDHFLCNLPTWSN